MDLKQMRLVIDRIDAEIMQLLTRRMEYAVRTKRFKTEIIDSSREEYILKRAKERASGLFQANFGEKLFKLVIAESSSLQAAGRALVAFQGEHGSYSEVALAGFNKDSVGIPCRELAEIFESVSSGAVDYGIVPMENSLEGAESEVQDLLIDSSLSIVAEIAAPVHHCLLTLKETDYRDIKDVYSNTRALSQCHGFIKRNKLEPKPWYDSAGAALMLLRERPSAAAVISSSLSAQLYELEILKEEIEDNPNNMTRYFVIAKEPTKEAGDKCSLVFTTPHRAGALLEVLNLFSSAGINLTKIESRPLKKDPDQVAFLLNFSGSTSDPKIAKTLELLNSHTGNHRILGCYKEKILEAT